jgi:hypothetical protein
MLLLLRLISGFVRDIIHHRPGTVLGFSPNKIAPKRRRPARRAINSLLGISRIRHEPRLPEPADPENAKIDLIKISMDMAALLLHRLTGRGIVRPLRGAAVAQG